MMKIEGSGSASGSTSGSESPDPLVRDMDPLIRIRIHTKMLWICNTGLDIDCHLQSLHVMEIFLALIGKIA
jgi:hypothetical protein